MAGTVYLLHFDKPYKHAKHYLGWASNLNKRLAAHQAGIGARLLEVVAQAGISWQLARTWKGDRTKEAQLKRHHGSVKLCPICKQEAFLQSLGYDLWHSPLE
jgi:predicted GIY-YIG superfamily endonuclease